MCGNFLLKISITVLLVFIITPASFLFGEEVSLLDEIVVTATKIKEKNFDIPTPVETITSEFLEINTPNNLSEPLKFMPGVDVANGGFWEATPIIRGLGSNRVLVLYDGDRETNIWAGRAPLTPFLDVNEVEKIEVVKGPASVLYGTDALGGVINIITKQPNFAYLDKWKFVNKFEGRYSSIDDGWFGSYTLSGGGKGFDFRFNFLTRDTDNYEDAHNNEVKHTFFNNFNINFKARYFFNDNNEIAFFYKRNNINDLGVPQKSNAKYSHFTKYDLDTYKLKYKGYNLGWFKEVQVNTWYINQERDYKGYFFSTSKPVHVLKGNDIDSNAFGITIQGQINFTNSNKFITGVEYIYENSESDEEQLYQKNFKNINIKYVTFKPLSDADRYHFGIFAQDELEIGNKLKLITGLRYDYFIADADDVPFIIKIFDNKGINIIKDKTTIKKFSRETDDAITYNLGMLYKCSSHIHFTANLSSGFRAPDVFERYSMRGGGFIIIGDPELDAEYSYNFDIGFKIDFEKFKAAFNMFYNRVDNYIDFVKKNETFNGLPVYKYVNIADAEFYGYDGSFEFHFLEKFKFFGNIAYVVGENRNNNERLNLIPPLNGGLGIRLKTKKYWTEINTKIYNRQKHPGNAEEETAGYAIFNFRSGIKFDFIGIKNINFTFNIDNLFDKQYKRHLTLSTLSSKIYEPGLSIISGIKFSF